MLITLIGITFSKQEYPKSCCHLHRQDFSFSLAAESFQRITFGYRLYILSNEDFPHGVWDWLMNS